MVFLRHLGLPTAPKGSRTWRRAASADLERASRTWDEHEEQEASAGAEKQRALQQAMKEMRVEQRMRDVPEEADEDADSMDEGDAD